MRCGRPGGCARARLSREYDFLIAPLLLRLAAGAGRAEISEFLWRGVAEHFGLDPASRGIDSPADLLVACWTTVADPR